MNDVEAAAGELDRAMGQLGALGAQLHTNVSGVPLDEPYIFPGDAPSKQKFNSVVPEGRLWLMGDHRSVSADSRSLLGAPGGGMVPLERVIGRPVQILWPLDRFAPVARPPVMGPTTQNGR